MEQKPSSYDSAGDRLLRLPAQYPWLVSQNLGAEEDGSTTDQIFCTLHDQLLKHQCQIPELTGKRIRGYYHGWVILSDNPKSVMWSLWNPVTSKMIDFPPLILKDGDSESIKECCLSAPPDDPNSVLLLTRAEKPSIVFFRLVSKRKKLLRWIEMSYNSQLKRITGEDGLFIYSLACCDGKVYALNTYGYFATFFIQLEIVVKKKEVLINLLLLGTEGFPVYNCCPHLTTFLKGSGTELFCIIVAFLKGKPGGVYFFKLDTTSLKSEEIRERYRGLDMTDMDWEEEDESTIINLGKTSNMWEELVDLKDAVFFVDLSLEHSYYKPEIASELGSYIHIRGKMGKILYTYHVKDNTISLSSMPSLVLPTSNVSLWECRLEDDGGEAKFAVDSKQKDDEIVRKSVVTDGKVEYEESHLLNLPLDILETIMEHCVGVEYMNFRATCKRFHLAAPLKNWTDESALERLQAYSLVSPWLMVLDNKQGIITFTDPIFGDNYSIKNRHILSVGYQADCCSRFGWVLFLSPEFNCMVFFNPFTGDIRKLPDTDYYFYSACFTAPPTSPDCMVVGFSTSHERVILIHYVAQEPSWRTLSVDVDPWSIRFPTFFGQDLYALSKEGELILFKDLGEENCSMSFAEANAPVSCCSSSPAQCYLMTRDFDLLKVIVSIYGEVIEVFKLNESKQEWEKTDSLGKHMIYICGSECVCIEAKTPEMENKIYFPILHSNSRKMAFYSLETCRYHTFNGANIEQHFKDFFGTTYHLSPHWWIEPSWS